MAKHGRKQAQAEEEEGLPSPSEEEGKKSTWQDGILEQKLSL